MRRYFLYEFLAFLKVLLEVLIANYKLTFLGHFEEIS